MKGKKLLTRAATAIAALFFLSMPAEADAAKRVRLHTSAGDIVIALYDETPAHRDNFLRLVGEGYYDGLLFHRVIRNFMIQGGDPDSRGAEAGKLLGEGGPAYTLPLEVALPERFHRRGAVAAARESDDVNPERRSSGSQFYIVWGQRQSASRLDTYTRQVEDATGGRYTITDEMAGVYRNVGGTPYLDGQYTVFGEVAEGLDIVDIIQANATDENDRPLVDVVILKAEAVEETE